MTPQTLAEFYSVVTSPRRVRNPRVAEEALAVITKILAMPGISLLPIPMDVVHRWTELVRRRPVTGSKIFDVQLVATMLGNGVTRIYTFNRADFDPFDELEVLMPETT